MSNLDVGVFFDHQSGATPQRPVVRHGRGCGMNRRQRLVQRCRRAAKIATAPKEAKSAGQVSSWTCRRRRNSGRTVGLAPLSNREATEGT